MEIDFRNGTVTKRSAKYEREMRLKAYYVYYLQSSRQSHVFPRRVHEVLDNCDEEGFFDIPRIEGKCVASTKPRQSGQIQSIEYQGSEDYNSKGNMESCNPILLTFEEYVRLGKPRALILKRKDTYKKAEW